MSAWDSGGRGPIRRPWMLPLTPFYLAGAALRWAGVQPKRLGWPVISVGNLSAGGTGKTPFVIALAKMLVREGVGVDVLSRGYGRMGSGAERVDLGGTAERFGDEPLLIAREAGVPVFVGVRRFETGALAEADWANGRFPSGMTERKTKTTTTEGKANAAVSVSPAGRRLHLLDDGFQHRQLYRDVDVVLVNSEDLADRVLPAGNLREPVAALGRASVFAVAVDDDAAVARLRELGFTHPIWRFRRKMTVIEAAGAVVAFCGIARPGQFFEGLEVAGLRLAAKKVFRDHHPFGTGDVEDLRTLVRETGAVALVTTAKDRIRLGSRLASLEAGLGVPFVTADLQIVFEDEESILDWLRTRLGI